MLIDDFIQPGKASFLLGGQWGSEAKGAVAAWLTEELLKRRRGVFDLYTTNAGAQAGHTSMIDGKKIVLFHLPTGAVIALQCGVPVNAFINAGAVIDVDVLLKEIEDYYDPALVKIHPMASVITPDCKLDSNRRDSQSTKVAGVRKGVGHAIAKKALRTGLIAAHEPRLAKFIDYSLEWAPHRMLDEGGSVLVEVPQGVSLSVNHSGFYPYTTSRDCTVMQAMSDAAIHPRYYHGTVMVIRTFPIRVGNIIDEDGQVIGTSGGHYRDQQETTWGELGVTAEITTVSKRVRRVFTFSEQQLQETLALTKPDIIVLTFCNYLRDGYGDQELVIEAVRRNMPMSTALYTQWGPTSADVHLSGPLPREAAE